MGRRSYLELPGACELSSSFLTELYSYKELASGASSSTKEIEPDNLLAGSRAPRGRLYLGNAEKGRTALDGSILVARHRRAEDAGPLAGVGV